MELQLQYNTNTPVGPIKSVSDSAVIATDLFAIPVAKAADLASNSGLVDPIMIDPNSSLPVDTTATGDQTSALPTDIGVAPIITDPTLVDPNSSLPVDTTATGDQTATLPTDIGVDPIITDPTLTDPNSSLPVDTTATGDQTATLPTDIGVDPIITDPTLTDPNSSLPVDTTATGDQTAALPTDISVDPIMIDPTLVDPNSGLLIEIVVAPIDIVPVDFIWPTDWSVDSSNALLTFNDITIADPILAIGSFEPILPPAVFDPSSVVISDNTATDVPSVSLIGVPDISVQTF